MDDAVLRLTEDLTSQRVPIPVFKQHLREYRERLKQRFFDGENVNILVHEHARFLDALLTLAWERFNWNENLRSWRKTRISLIAVGGYGRGELHPSSDIDLLILLERNHYQLHASNIQSFLTLLWDIGLEVGHSVRSIKDSRHLARADVTVITAMMEARTIAGNDELRALMVKQTAVRRMWSAKAFFEAKINEQYDRHQKSDHTEYSLEPNVKTSPGGLRDIQTVMWIAKRRFGAVTFEDLVEKHFLTPSERDILADGQSLLWKIRFGLHAITGKAEDRLLFEYQKELSSLLGFEDNDQLAVEQFMQQYYLSAMQIRMVTELLLQHFDEAILRANERVRISPVDKYFRIANNYIEVTSPDVFVRHPPALLKIFVAMGKDADIKGIRAATVRLIQASVDLIDDQFRSNPEVTELFLTLLRSGEHLFSQLRRMERYGILGAYIPEFQHIIGQMQFDLFHIYTVDAHTLQVVRNMRRFRYKNREQEFPIAAHIHARLPKIELLYIAGLYHDIAKGMGGDHSQLGEDMAVSFCERHGLSTWDTNLVAWLVRNHLVMSGTAQRKDISDPEVIREFALFVADQVRLDYLYALTVADINATNPTLWNGWRASLMRGLYLETKKQLRQGLENYVDRSEYIHENQEHAISRLAEHGLTLSEIMEAWGHVDEDYFVRESISDISWHTIGIHEHEDNNVPLVLIRNGSVTRRDEGATHIFIHSHKRATLFRDSVNALVRLNLDIVDARIAESVSGFMFYTFIILNDQGKPVSEGSQFENIRSTLLRHIMSDDEISPKPHRTPRILKPFSFKTEIILSHDEARGHTILQVTTPDRPGLLALISDVFMTYRLQLLNARITTLGERVEDLFYLVDADGNMLEDERIGTPLVSELQERLDLFLEEAAA